MSETRPPKEFDHIRHHWLHSERASFPSVAEWLRGAWYCTGERGPVAPEKMYDRGWEWYAPAYPPKTGAKPYGVHGETIVDFKVVPLDLDEGSGSESDHESK